jgi:hypothetical protein
MNDQTTTSEPAPLPATANEQAAAETPELDLTSVLDHLHPDTFDLAYTALADALEKHTRARLDVNEWELVLRFMRAQLYESATADCKNDKERDRALLLATEDYEKELYACQTAEINARLEVDLARLEVERNKVLWSIAGFKTF